MCTIRAHHQQFFTGMLDLKSKSQLSLKFSFFIQQEYAKNPMKNNKHRKETHPRPPTPKITAWYFNILGLVFQSVDVHLSLIHKKRPEHKANSAKQGEFINNGSKYRKIVGSLFKGKWNELGLFVAQFLECCRYKGIVYVISLFNKNCASLCKYIYQTRTIFCWVLRHEHESSPVQCSPWTRVSSRYHSSDERLCERLFKFTW